MTKAKPQLPFNPFADSVVGDPWTSNEPDVAGINAEVFQSLLSLTRSLPKTPNVAALVFGSAGSGKTHLIKRLMNNKDVELVFVYVHPMKDHRRMFTRLMETVATNLESPMPGYEGPEHVTQLDVIVTNVISAAFEQYLERNPDDPGKTFLKTIKKNPLSILSFIKSKKWGELLDRTREFLRKSSTLVSPMAKETVKALFHYLDAEKREAVRTLLSGHIPDDEECKALGIRFNEGDLSVESQEERSREILVTMGKLLKFYHPMIICFDQLENLNEPKLLRGFGTLVQDIVNRTENILPISFVRPERWDEDFKKHLDVAARARIEGNVYSLQGCSPDQALELVKARLDWAFDGVTGHRPSEYYPLDLATLSENLLGVSNPREVLSVANRMLGSVPPDDPIDVVFTAYEAEREMILSAQTKQPPRRETVVEGLRLCFSNRGDSCTYEVNQMEVGGNSDLRMDIKLRNEEDPKPVELLFETAAHWKPLQKSLDYLSQRIRAREVGSAIFIRDARHKIPPKKGRMPQTVKRLEKFRELGGYAHYIDYPHLADLYALVYTADKIGSKDLSYATSHTGALKSVELAHLQQFIRERFQSDFVNDLERAFLSKEPGKAGGTKTEIPPEPPPPEPDDLKVVDNISTILGKPPFKFTLEHVHSRLEKKMKKAPDKDRLAELIGEHSALFGCLTVTPPIYFLKKGK